MQLSPLKLLCGAKGGEDNPDESRPSSKIYKLEKILIITLLFLYTFFIYKSNEMEYIMRMINIYDNCERDENVMSDKNDKFIYEN